MLALLMLLGCIRPSLPGRSFQGPLPAADDALLESAARIQAVIDELAGAIGPRSFAVQPGALAEAQARIEARWQEQGFVVERQRVASIDTWITSNLIVRVPGHGPPLVIGAHYDTVHSTPGADDNASGVAALLELTRVYAPPVPYEGRELLFVAWTLEEPPFFATRAQGSAVHAGSLQEVHGAISLETIGLYDDRPHSQQFPFPLGLFYPSRGDFVAFVGNTGSHRFVKEIGRGFRNAERFPSRGGSAPGWIPGIDWSDHRSYWHLGPALMVTDTAPFRNPHYHEPSDLPATVDPVAVARVTRGLAAVIDVQRHGWTGSEAAPALAPLEITAVSPVQLDSLRGGLLTVRGQGFSSQLRARLDHTTVPIVEVLGPTELRVRVQDLGAGVYDLSLTGTDGSVELPAAVNLTTGAGPPRDDCHTTVTFEHSSAELSPEAARTFERERFCFVAYAGPIQITGHTDRSGSSGTNESLGLERAQRVADLLTSLGIEPARLQVTSSGEADAAGLTEDQRRRVDVRLEGGASSTASP